ncbi:hypothetical protein GC177_04680 [bacterium]|nr:hypothetical protein [bacterium]
MVLAQTAVADAAVKARLAQLEKMGLKVIGPWTQMVLEGRARQAEQLPLFAGHNPLDMAFSLLQEQDGDALARVLAVMPQEQAMADAPEERLRALLARSPNAHLEGNWLVIDEFIKGPVAPDEEDKKLPVPDEAMKTLQQGLQLQARVQALSGGLAIGQAANTARRIMNPDRLRELVGDEQAQLPTHGFLAQQLQKQARSQQQTVQQQFLKDPEIQEIFQASLDSAMELYSMFAAAGNEAQAASMLSHVAGLQDQLNRMKDQQQARMN